MLGFFDVLIGSIVEVADGDFYASAPTKPASVRPRGIGDGKWDVQQGRQVLQKAVLPQPDGPIMMTLDFSISVPSSPVGIAVFHALIVVVYRDGQDLLGVVLVDDVFVEVLLDEMRTILVDRIVERIGKFLRSVSWHPRVLR